MLSPETFSSRAVLAGKPAEVVSKRSPLRWRPRSAVYLGLVGVEQLIHGQRNGPAVERDVMEAPDHDLMVRQADHGHSNRWSGRKVETYGPVFRQELFKPVGRSVRAAGPLSSATSGPVVIGQAGHA